MITADQVTALTAQQAADQRQRYPSQDDAGNLLSGWITNTAGDPVYVGAEISTRGVGIYGQTIAGLENIGYLKPGTVNLITTASMTITVLNNTSVWTGQNGIDSLLSYLDEPVLQNLAQIQIMQGAYQGLIDAGVITGQESARYIASYLQPATRYGVDTVVSWITGRTSGELGQNLRILARQGQYAIDFVEQIVNIGIDVPGAENTVERTELDQAVADIIGNSKIPNIEYADVAATVDVAVPQVNDEEGTFRFAPNRPRG